MDRILILVAIVWFAVMNLFGILIMREDKRRARLKSFRRIPERRLFMVSILGGSLGTWLAMYLYHHKTKHWYFVVFMPLIFFVHLAAVIVVACLCAGVF